MDGRGVTDLTVADLDQRPGAHHTKGQREMEWQVEITLPPTDSEGIEALERSMDGVPEMVLIGGEQPSLLIPVTANTDLQAAYRVDRVARRANLHIEKMTVAPLP